MKTLLIMRHGEAENPTYGESDKNRNLSENGMQEVFLKGKLLKEKGIKIDTLLVSDAVRTTQTAGLVAEQTGFDTNLINYTEHFYNGSLGKILDEISKIESSSNNVLIVAHNPGVAYLHEYLTENYIHFSTSTISIIHLEIDSWNLLIKGIGKEVEVF